MLAWHRVRACKMIATFSFLVTKTPFVEEQQTRKLLGRELLGRERLVGESVCLSVSLPPSLPRQAWEAQPLFLVLVFLDFLLIWGQLILVRNRCLLPFSPACLFRKKSIVVFNIIKFICSLGVSMLRRMALP